MNTSLYPPSPQLDDLSLVKPSKSYRLRAILVLVSIIFFLALYISLIVGAGYLIYWLAVNPVVTLGGFYTLLIYVGTIAMAGMLFIFILKSLFKKHTMSSPFNVEITEQEHPELFAFIRTLSKEVKAPFPKKVFVNHEINASVFYNSTILSLFLPVKKNLLIGLGLVNSINLSEFKAVLAHEFGHFSQRSMKLGSYIYIANTIIYSMVFERDGWDRFLDQWKQADIRVSIFAWLLMPIVWIIRQLMQLIYQVINMVYAALSRQMEFQADRVAVSVTGSEAIINGLYKLNSASQAFQFSNQQIGAAIDHKLYTDDLFYHQTQAFEHLKENYPEFEEALIQHKKGEYLFTNESENRIEMYASHPPHFQRERSAKEIFVEGPVDDRSPWILFHEPEKLKAKVTRNLLNLSLNLPANTEFQPADEVAAFIQRELEETTYDPRYQGVYEDRFLTDVKLAEGEDLIKELGINEETLPQIYEDLYTKELAAQKKVVMARGEHFQLVLGIINKEDKRKEFTIKGETYKASQARAVFEDLKREAEADQSWYEEFDKKVFALHAFMMHKVVEEQAEFKKRYNFHIGYQGVLKTMNSIQERLHNIIQGLMDAEELTEYDVDRYNRSLVECKRNFENQLNKLPLLVRPQLHNLEEVEALDKFVLEEPFPWDLSILNSDSINEFAIKVDGALGRGRRIYFKSLGGLLKVQERISEAYLGQ